MVTIKYTKNKKSGGSIENRFTTDTKRVKCLKKEGKMLKKIG